MEINNKLSLLEYVIFLVDPFLSARYDPAISVYFQFQSHILRLNEAILYCGRIKHADSRRD
jgi:hypothetical protein